MGSELREEAWKCCVCGYIAYRQIIITADEMGVILDIKKHECRGMKANFTVPMGWVLEDRGDGWRMYNQNGEKSAWSIHFCPQCSMKLS